MRPRSSPLHRLRQEARELARRLARKCRRFCFEHLRPRAPWLYDLLFFHLRRWLILLQTRRFAVRPGDLERLFAPAPSTGDSAGDVVAGPRVSIIVPCYNHAAYLPQRLESIAAQTYTNVEIILLDDGSSDDSPRLLSDFARRHPDRTRLCLSPTNSGQPFRQWRKGLAMASGDLVWIAESDDFCDPDFLEVMVPLFRNQAVMIGFCATLFCDESGQRIVWTLADYIPDIAPDRWRLGFTDAAAHLVEQIWSRRNLIPNASAALFRRPDPQLPLLNDPAWLEMRICGDWLLYLHLCRGGLVSYTSRTRSHYRQHGSNTSVSLQRSVRYLEEHLQLAQRLLTLHRLSPRAVAALQAELRQRWAERQSEPLPAALERQLQALAPLQPPARGPNILMATYSLIPGGGEILPLRLANLLKQAGHAVTVVHCRQHPTQAGIRRMLRADIPLIELESLESLGLIVEQLAIEILHTHHPWVDTTFCELLSDRSRVRHVVTSHGMYDELPPAELRRIERLLQPWVREYTYVADGNRDALLRIGADPAHLTKIANAIDDLRPAPVPREQLAIADDAFVVCLASRAIRHKGWEEAIEIIERARQTSPRDIQLLLIGEGAERQRLRQHGSKPYIHFLGFRPNCRDYFASSDLGLLPSFYPGESQPLTLIESLSAGTPYLASDIGEIRSMLSLGDRMAGQAIPLRDACVDIEAFARAIARCADEPALLERYRQATAEVVRKFSPQDMLRAYEDVYARALASAPVGR